jgi:hypothetical protein
MSAWQTEPVLADDFLPVYDISDEVAVVAEAEPADAWSALMDADLIAVGMERPLVGLLGAVRVLPELVLDLLHGERPEQGPTSARLKDLAELPAAGGGWTLLAERPGEEIALGLVGKFWRPVIEYAEVPAGDFRDWATPGFAKTVYDLGVRPLDPGRSLIWGLMRTATTDEHARTWFRRYWTLGVGSGAHLLVHGLLESVREAAERR